MKALCTQENLRVALSALERVAGKQSSLPILSNILIETEKGQLKLSATNLEIGVVVYVVAKIEADGGLTVPARLLSTFVQNLASDKIIELSEDRGHLLLKSEKQKAKLKGLEKKEFPLIPHFDRKYTLSFPAAAFRKAVESILFCVSTNETRIELTGVYVAFEANRVVLAATDSFRLGETHLEMSVGEAQLPEGQSVIIPTQTVQEILRVLQDEESLWLAIEDNQLFFKVGGVRIVSRLISAKFPDYQQIIPKSFQATFSLKREEFLRALKFSHSFSVYGSGEVALLFSNETKELTLLTHSAEVGENSTTLPFTGTGSLTDPMIFHPRLLVESVAALSGEEIDFSCNTPTTPALIKSVANPETQYLIMPVPK